MNPAEAGRERLRAKYLRLGLGELAAVAVFAYLAVVSVGPRLDGREARAALWFALAPLVVVLVQASVYWLLARSWVAERAMPTGLALTYRALSVGDAVLLLAGLTGVIVWLPHEPLPALAILALWAFGVIEFVNHYLVRLAYPVRQWFTKVGLRRRPRLALDINQSLQTRHT